MWRTTRQQTTWIQICVFTFMYSFIGSYIHSEEYYIRRGFDDFSQGAEYAKADVFGYPKRSSPCLGPKSFYSHQIAKRPLSWPRPNIELCTYRCEIYSVNQSEGIYTFLPEEKKCLLNSVARARLNNCMVLLVGENWMGSPLLVLDLNDSSKFQALDNNKLRDGCKIIGQHFYVSNGTWEKIQASHITFQIKNKSMLSWKSKDATFYMGRIIKLQLKNCRKQWNIVNVNECIIFKAKGNFHYKPFLASTVKLEPCPTSSMSQHSSLSSLHATMTLTSTSFCKVFQSTSPNATTVALPSALPSASEQVSTSTSYVKVFQSTSPNATTVALPSVLPSASEQVSTSTSYVKVSQSTIPYVTTMALSPLIPSTSQQVPVVITTINTPSTSAQTEGPTTPHPGGDGHSSQESSDIESVLAGVITTFVIIIIICLVVVVLCKRRRSSNKSRRSLKAANISADNHAYERNKNQIIPLSSKQKRSQVNEDYDNIEYDYAAVDGVQVHNKNQPVYQSLERGNEKAPQIYQSLMINPDLKKPDDADSKEYSYDHLQHPVYNPPHPKDTSSSLYNSLQKPGGDDDYLEPETQIIDNPIGVSEPVYNVLEDPDGNPATQHNDPVYNVLEDPNANQCPQDNDPVYNVLEGPDDDYDNAPTDEDQNVTVPASGQDNVAYSSTIDLNIPQSPSSPDYDVLEGPEGALSDSMYQPLGIRVHDDVYQPLDRTSQPVYQTLKPNDSTA